MSHDDEALNIDLHVWRVPEPTSVDAASLVARALRPAAVAAKRPRLRWFAAAIILVNAAIAALLVIVLARPATAPTPTTIVMPAGGGPSDASVRDLLARLEQKQKQLEQKQKELELELDKLKVTELSDRLHRDGQTDHDCTVPKPVDRPPAVVVDTSCDEVSCVLSNYEGTCCAQFQRPHGVPDGLDRAAISNAMAKVRADIMACGTRFAETGVVKAHVLVDGAGTVTQVLIPAAPSTALGECVSAAVQKATFPRTKNGGSFTYPFVF
jgi:hypothetical protein